MNEKEKLYRTINEILTFCFKCAKVVIGLLVVCLIITVVFGK